MMNASSLRLFCLACALCALVACASGRKVTRSAAAPADSAPETLLVTQGEYEEEAAALEASLVSVLAEEQAVDCEEAHALKERICALADRICAIAEEHPERAELPTLCEDAKARCERARSRVDERCPEPRAR